MPMNFLEQLVAEWYEYRGYFIRRNVLVGPRPNGGFECELDVVAFHPSDRHLVHVEASTDASSWAERDKKFARKFKAGRLHIPSIFAGLDIPPEIEQVAVLVFASKKNRETVGGQRLLLASELLAQIFETLGGTSIYSGMVPEQYPLLRSLQFVSQNRETVWKALEGTKA